MHWQREPHGECKLVRCTMGEIFDVVVDVRPESPTYCQWVGEVLSADNHMAFYIPEGCAHGFQTLTQNAEVFYQMSQTYVSDAAAGARWNDIAFGIQWPIGQPVMSDRDRNCPDFETIDRVSPESVEGGRNG